MTSLRVEEVFLMKMWENWLDDERSFENIVIRLIVISYLVEKGLTAGVI